MNRSSRPARDGFTLLETTLALALLSVLAMVAVSWTTSTLHLRARSTQADARSRTLGAAERALRIDLLNHDITAPARLRREERVWIASERLHILTRESGDAEAVYRFQDGELIRTTTHMDPGVDPHSSTLIGQLNAAAFELISSEESPWAELVVILQDAAGDSAIRITIPREWAR